MRLRKSSTQTTDLFEDRNSKLENRNSKLENRNSKVGSKPFQAVMLSAYIIEKRTNKADGMLCQKKMLKMRFEATMLLKTNTNAFGTKPFLGFEAICGERDWRFGIWGWQADERRIRRCHPSPSVRACSEPIRFGQGNSANGRALSPSLGVILSGAKNLFHYRSGQAARRILCFCAPREENRTQ